MPPPPGSPVDHRSITKVGRAGREQVRFSKQNSPNLKSLGALFDSPQSGGVFDLLIRLASLPADVQLGLLTLLRALGGLTGAGAMPLAGVIEQAGAALTAALPETNGRTVQPRRHVGADQ